MKAEEAIKEFAEKVMKEYCRWWSIEARDTDKFISDLTTLISEHYYPKEFVEWISNEKETIEGTYNYWLKNIRKENEI